MPWFISKVLLQLASFSNKVQDGNYSSWITDACRLRAVIPLYWVLRSRLITVVWMNSHRVVGCHINNNTGPLTDIFWRKKHLHIIGHLNNIQHQYLCRNIVSLNMFPAPEVISRQYHSYNCSLRYGTWEYIWNWTSGQHGEWRSWL